MKFAAVLRGHCWLTFPEAEPYSLKEGDVFLLANAPSYVLANDRQKTPGDGIALFDWEHADVAHHGGDDTVLVAGSFIFETTQAQGLLDTLPPFMPIPASNAAPSILHTTLASLDSEIRCPRMGAALVIHRLAEILLVQALRAYVAEQGIDSAGWIGAFADPQIGAALNLMHNHLARRWTVAELARAIGMSRSAFALRFKKTVGAPPLDYLLRWRMQRAREGLRRGEPLSRIAASTGYASESAFSNAFKRVCGTPPRRYWSTVDPETGSA